MFKKSYVLPEVNTIQSYSDEYNQALLHWDILKNGPISYRVVIRGVCKTVSVGSITKKAYQYWKNAANQHTYKVEDLIDDPDLNIPDYANIFSDDDWLGLNDIYGNFVAVQGCSDIFIYNQNGQCILKSSLNLDDLKAIGIQTNKNLDVDDVIAKSGTVFIGNVDFEGLYYEGSFTLSAPFEPSKLLINYDVFAGEHVFYNLYYNDDFINPNDADADHCVGAYFGVYKS